VNLSFAGALIATLALDALGVRVKLGASATLSVNAAVRVRPPPVPVRVTVEFPTTALAAAVMVTVLVEVIGFGLNPTVTPLGKAEAVKVTLLVKPCNGVSVTVLVPLAP